MGTANTSHQIYFAVNSLNSCYFEIRGNKLG